MTTEDKQTGNDIEPGQAWEVRRFSPEDAEGVAQLFRKGYGDGYPIRTYMDPELLIRENEAQRVISSVARTPKGDIVGHAAIYADAPHPGVYESGAALLHPAYRGRINLYPRLIAHGFELAASFPHVEVLFGEMVCNHVISQKLAKKVGLVPTALEPGLMPAEAYETGEDKGARVASVVSFRIIRQSFRKIYLPTAYAQVLPYFYEGVTLDRDFLPAEENSPDGSLSDITEEIFDFAKIARIAVRKVGRDFPERMESMEKILTEKGMAVFHVWLNMADPGNGEAVDCLRKQGYFLGGVLPHWFGTDGLLMQKVLTVPHWEGIHLHEERSRRILEKVRTDWVRSTNEGQRSMRPCFQEEDK